MNPSTRIAIRAPEYFPGLPYVALMMSADVFVLADTQQYSRQSFQNRARIRQAKGTQWLTIPLLDGQFGSAIRDVRVKTTQDWQGQHRRALYYNYSSSAMYEFFESLLDRVFDVDSDRLADFTCASVLFLRDLFELQCRVIRSSELEGTPRDPSEILAHFDRMEYVALADTAEYDARGCRRMKILQFEEPVYRQNFSGFEQGVSALDLLFNYGPEGLSYLREGVVRSE